MSAGHPIQLRMMLLCAAGSALAMAFAVPCRAVLPESNHVRIVPTLDKTALAMCHANTSWGIDLVGLGLGASLPKDTFAAEEPVRFIVTLINRNDQRCAIDRQYRGNYMISLDIVVVGPGSTLIELRSPNRKDFTYDRGKSIGSFLDGRGYEDLEIDLSQMFDLTPPGQYLVYAKRRIYGEVLTSGNAMFVVASKNTAPSGAAATASPESAPVSPRFKRTAATASDGDPKPYGFTNNQNKNTKAHRHSTSASQPFAKAKPPVHAAPPSGSASVGTLVATASALSPPVRALGTTLAILCAGLILFIISRARQRAPVVQKPAAKS